MHAKDIASALEVLARRLDEEGVPFGVVGALAVREYGYARYTEDINIVTTAQGLETMHRTLLGRDLVLRAAGLKRSFRDPNLLVNVDVIVAGDPAGAEGSPVTYPDPSSESWVRHGAVRVPTLPALIEFKIASGTWGHRDLDLADVQKLIQANGLDESFAASIRPELRGIYIGLLERSRLERRIE